MHMGRLGEAVSVFKKAAKSPCEGFLIPIEEVASELINRDGDDQLGRARLLCSRLVREKAEGRRPSKHDRESDAESVMDCMHERSSYSFALTVFGTLTHP